VEYLHPFLVLIREHHRVENPAGTSVRVVTPGGTYQLSQTCVPRQPYIISQQSWSKNWPGDRRRWCSPYL